jgi:23S rRNA (adenine2030-N6)-methyltransferase
MLSYQHGYHAGGPADVHKHGALAAMLTLLKRKPRPISYLESHAGRGVYDLDDPAALKTGEAARGVALLPPADDAYHAALAAVRDHFGPSAYPGSPGVARALLGPEDHLVLMELHPQEHAALVAALGAPGCAIHRRDGHEGLRALTPPSPRRGLALIDPSYEVKDEYARTARTALDVLRRWPEGVVMVWYPVLDAPRHAPLVEAVEASRPAGLLRREVAFADAPARGMVGSGLLVLNAPHGAAQAMDEAARAAGPVFAQGAGLARGDVSV